MDGLQSHPSPLPEEELLRLRSQLESAVATLCPPSLADRREDLVQEAMLKVSRLLAGAEEGREFNATYLWRTAYSALVDELRRLRRRAEVPLEEPASGAPGSADGPGRAYPSPRPGPAEVSRGREIRSFLNACLERLVQPRRLAVILYLQGEKGTSAADLLGWPLKRVQNLTFRGLRDLRSCLEAHGVTP